MAHVATEDHGSGLLGSYGLALRASSSSSIPGNGVRKLVDVYVLTNQLGTPRGGCEEHNSKFSLNCVTKVSRRKNQFLKVVAC
jgi:hypothetical protein